MQGKSNKKVWYSVHRWSALPVWGLLVLICITGTVCTVTQEITWLYAPEVRAANPESVDPLPWDALAEAVTSAYPGTKLESMHVEESYLAYLVRVQLPEGERKRLYLNQYSGQVQGEVQGAGFRGFMLSLHGWLLLPWQDGYSVGWYIVTAVSVPLLASLVSGLFIFKRFWRALYHPRLRWRQRSRVFWGDVHRLLAVWSLPFILIISSSGLWFLVQGVLDHNEVAIFPEAPVLPREAIPLTSEAEGPERLTLDGAASVAREIYPDLRISYIELPDDARAPMIVRGTRGISLLRDTAHGVYLNPYTGAVMGALSSPDLSLAHFLSALLMPLHFGDFAGLVSKLIWFFFGCLLSTVVCSGFIVWSKQTARKKRVA